MIFVFAPVFILGMVHAAALLRLVLTIQRMRKSGDYPPIPPYSAVILPYWDAVRISWGATTFPPGSLLFAPARLMRWTTWASAAYWAGLILLVVIRAALP